jgi:putative holliday junction resolvase
MRHLALDFGERRIGVAVGSPETGLTFPRKAIDRKKVHEGNSLRVFCSEESIKKIVVGMPSRTDGKPGEREDRVRSWSEKMLSPLDIPYVFQDEAYSTQRALDLTSHYSTKNKQDKGKLDSAAACVILNDYFESIQNSKI